MVVADLGGWTTHLSGLADAPAPQGTILKNGKDDRGAARNLDGLFGQTLDLDWEPLDALGRTFRRTTLLLVVGRAKVFLPRNPRILRADNASPLLALSITVATPHVDIAVSGQGSAVAITSSDGNNLSVRTVQEAHAIGNRGGEETLDEAGNPACIDFAGRAGNGVVELAQGSFVIAAPGVNLSLVVEDNIKLSSRRELYCVSGETKWGIICK